MRNRLSWHESQARYIRAAQWRWLHAFFTGAAVVALGFAIGMLNL